jgi:cytochrome c biogenesis protein CcmG, thiol:disulfide interchange protein DsbE
VTSRRILTFSLLALVVVASIAVWQVLAGSHSAASDVLVDATGKPAPSFSLPELTGATQKISLTSLRGEPVVLNFWASDCPPCRSEMPLLQEQSKAVQGKVRFLGVDTLDNAGAARSFASQVHVSYPIVVDASGQVASKYGVFGIPTTVFISADGKIAGKHIGQLDGKTLREALGQAFPGV